MPGADNLLESLYGKYGLVVATKGDLMDQERKLKKSGLQHYFHHSEVTSDKQEADYHKLINHLDCDVNEFLMLRNSLKSDVIPVLAIDGNAFHIPFHATRLNEYVEEEIIHPNFHKINTLTDILTKLRS